MRRTFFWLVAVTLVAACHTPPRAARATLGYPPAPAATAAPERELTRETALATFDSVWAKIRNTYYDTTLKGLDWNGVRRELRPHAERATTYAALRAVLTDMLGRLGDSHMTVLPREFASAPNESSDDGRPGGVGIEARIIGRDFVVWRVDPSGPAARSGVRPGWIVDRIDSIRPDSAIAELAAVRDARLRRTLSIQVTARLQHRFEGAAKTSVHAAFRDERGKPQRLAMVRTPLLGQAVKMGHMPTLVVHASSYRIDNVPAANRCVGVMRFNYWLLPVMTELTSAMHSFSSCAGVVIDLRGNVGGLAAMLSGVSGFLADTAATLAVVASRGQEVRYDVFPRRADRKGERVQPYSGPIALLIDPLTVSTSEVFAAGMRLVTHGRARIFGERSAGQALPALVYKLPTGDVLMHAIGDLRLADGTRIEGAGVRPDVEVPLRRSDLLAGRDAALSMALGWIGAWNKRGRAA